MVYFITLGGRQCGLIYPADGSHRFGSQRVSTSMSIKALLGIGLLAMGALSFATPKDCEVLIPRQTHAGASTLAPGQYRVEVQGSNAVFTNVKTGQAIAAPVKVETTKAHEATSIEVDKRGDDRFLKSIDLANSDQTLEFE